MARSADRLIMLLSTDWFSPFWTVIGLAVEAAAKIQLQQDCRAIVRDFIGSTPTYWDVSFADERINETNRRFMAVLRRQNLDEAMIGRISDIVVRLSSEDLESRLVPMLADITRQMIARKAKNPIGLSENTVDLLGDAWQICDPKIPRLDTICRRSATEWDRYIAGLTPDLPTSLADYASVILRRNQLLCYWRNVENTLSPTERSGMIQWYAAEAAGLAGEPMRMPDWMK